MHAGPVPGARGPVNGPCWMPEVWGPQVPALMTPTAPCRPPRRGAPLCCLAGGPTVQGREPRDS